MSASSYPVLRSSSPLSARARLEEATRLRDQAVRECMPSQMIDFLDRKVLEASADARREEIEELRERGKRLKVVEATPSERETMEQYINARRRGFGKRIAPVPVSLDREDAEAVYGKSVELRTSRRLPPNTIMSSEEMDRAMKEMYAKTQRDVDAQIFGMLNAGVLGTGPDAARRAAELTPRQREAVARSVPKKKAQVDVAQVSGKRRIALDE